MAMDGEKLKAIKGIVDPKNIKSDPGILSAHAVDGVVPWTVVFPENLEQVSDLVRLAQKDNLALIPWGSGSKMSMGHPPSRLDLVIGLTNLNKILDINRKNLTVTVQSGVKFKDIQKILAVQENVINTGATTDIPEHIADPDPSVKIVQFLVIDEQYNRTGSALGADRRHQLLKGGRLVALIDESGISHSALDDIFQRETLAERGIVLLAYETRVV